MKLLLSLALQVLSGSATAGWVEYTTRSNGDVHFYDDARVVRTGSAVDVWTRVRYRTSIMGASSYQSLLRLDCAERSETVLQSTFYSDRDWTTPAMATNTNAKPTKTIASRSATDALAGRVCTP